MQDDKTKTGARDQNSGSDGEPSEVEQFARHHGIDVDKARDLIDEFGNDRPALVREVAKLKEAALRPI
jgi:hypothetical protein